MSLYFVIVFFLGIGILVEGGVVIVVEKLVVEFWVVLKDGRNKNGGVGNLLERKGWRIGFCWFFF